MAKQVSRKAAGMEDCEFMVRSEDEGETVEFVREHARKVHNRNVSRSDVEKLMTPSSTKA